MVWKDRSGKYLRPDDVRIKYDPKTDSVVLTTKDPDVLNNTRQGFRIIVPRNSPEDKALREVLKQYGLYDTSAQSAPLGEHSLGVLPNGDWFVAPTNDILDVNGREMIIRSNENNSVVLGIDDNNKPVHWNYESSPHLLITGLSGTGKTIAMNTLFSQLSQGEKNAQVFKLTPTSITSKAYIKRYVNIVNDTMSLRYDELENDPSLTFDPVFLMFDEIGTLFDADQNQYDLREIHRACTELAARGRRVNVHLIISTQVLHWIPAQLQDLITTFISLRVIGETAHHASKRLFGSDIHASLLGSMDRQRGIVNDGVSKPRLIKMASPVQ